MSVTHLQSTGVFEPGLPRGFSPRGFRVLLVSIYSQLSCRASSDVKYVLQTLIALASQHKVNLSRLNFIETASAITIPAQDPSANEGLGVLSNLVRVVKKRPDTSLKAEATPQTYDGLFREAEAFVRRQTGVKEPPVTLVCDIADLLIRRLKAKQDPETGTVTFPEAN